MKRRSKKEKKERCKGRVLGEEEGKGNEENAGKSERGLQGVSMRKREKE